jgi:hypothetical protein
MDHLGIPQSITLIHFICDTLIEQYMWQVANILEILPFTMPFVTKTQCIIGGKS